MRSDSGCGRSTANDTRGRGGEATRARGSARPVPAGVGVWRLQRDVRRIDGCGRGRRRGDRDGRNGGRRRGRRCAGRSGRRRVGWGRCRWAGRHGRWRRCRALRGARVYERRAVRAPELRRCAAAVQSASRRRPVRERLDPARVVSVHRAAGVRAATLHAAGFHLHHTAGIVRRDPELFVSSRERLPGGRGLQHHQSRRSPVRISVREKT